MLAGKCMDVEFESLRWDIRLHIPWGLCVGRSGGVMELGVMELGGVKEW